MLVVGERIKQERKNKKLTQIELANKANVSRTYVSDVENGRYNPSLETLNKIANALNIKLKDLLIEDDDINNRIDNNPQDKIIISVPVLKRIPVGVSIEAIENIEDYEDVVINDISESKNYFCLKVKGNSMFPRIQEDDIVIIHKQVEVKDGDIAAIHINGGEVTLKQVKNFKDGIILRPFNPDFEPMFYTVKEIENYPVKILGKVVELRSKF